MCVHRVLQQRMLADAKQDMKEKRAQLLASMREMPDYTLQVGTRRHCRVCVGCMCVSDTTRVMYFNKLQPASSDSLP